MQALLSYDQAPPFAAPFRFFITAPLFAILAGLLLLWSGPDLLASRWTPQALALTHLLTVGFMMQVMLGAMVQILPVVTGANMTKPLWLASIVHAAITVGALSLVLAFLTYSAYFFGLAAVCLGMGVFVFVRSTAHALYRVPSITPTIHGLKLSLVGLSVTASLGVLLAISLAGSFSLPLMQLADIHLTWGLVAWGSVIIASVAYVVVPMFQLTPAYPSWFERKYSYAALSVVVLWSLSDMADLTSFASVCSNALVMIATSFLLVTLRIQNKSKRAKFDATQHYWRIAMVSALIASVLWFASRIFSLLGEWQGWPLLCAVLLLVGGFMSVMVGMLYKIVPFLVWLHLQNMGRGRLMAPNMKKVIFESQMQRQMIAHVSALVLLLLAVFSPVLFVYPAGIAFVIANAWLLRNLLAAASVYRRHRQQIEALASKL